MLKVRLSQRNSWRTPVNNDADTATVRFPKGRNTKKMAVKAGHARDPSRELRWCNPRAKRT